MVLQPFQLTYEYYMLVTKESGILEPNRQEYSMRWYKQTVGSRKKTKSQQQNSMGHSGIMPRSSYTDIYAWA